MRTNKEKQYWLDDMIRKNKLPQFNTIEDMIRQMRPHNPVIAFHPHRLKAKADLFKQYFHGHVLYAVKCNPHPCILDMLHHNGISHFDTASLGEIQLLKSHYPNSHCYFMHPVKSRHAISEASRQYDIRHYVCDHINELDKICTEIQQHPNNVIFVRLSTDAGHASYDLSEKFGASAHEAVILLQHIKQRGFKAGIAFHIGSLCRDETAFTDALEKTKIVIENANIDIDYLDIGGGFPAPYPNTPQWDMATTLQHINNIIDDMALGDDVIRLCEPGRAMVAEAQTLIAPIHLRKGNKLYIGDGIYGCLSELIYQQFTLPTRVFSLDKPKDAKITEEFQIFGPTCDCVDKLPNVFSLPSETQAGDWLIFEHCGAYSNAIISNFNGFATHDYVEITHDD